MQNPCLSHLLIMITDFYVYLYLENVSRFFNWKQWRRWIFHYITPNCYLTNHLPSYYIISSLKIYTPSTDAIVLQFHRRINFQQRELLGCISSCGKRTPRLGYINLTRFKFCFQFQFNLISLFIFVQSNQFVSLYFSFLYFPLCWIVLAYQVLYLCIPSYSYKSNKTS